jgi:hypothetical protein
VLATAFFATFYIKISVSIAPDMSSDEEWSEWLTDQNGTPYRWRRGPNGVDYDYNYVG